MKRLVTSLFADWQAVDPACEGIDCRCRWLATHAEAIAYATAQATADLARRCDQEPTC